ncbi:AIR synthase family protein [Natronobacterium gregoryi]|uniref:AIR synthase-like protein domain-containing protein n=2 Tax=Natronobacterium gregoryi TaxID=44930 RepID=L0AJM3_NATGS|nr:AIR synthase family protein [Natronobacterium gregoryi]AFZ73250.1 hydrogenase maturation factor [Natronobacterium gregoryi SP2]ELY71291.1 AIR synthase-like protein domain-containing protein [Natronobacterium gregoryi SP2]PLK21657.1 hydrogenase expression protein [Natronobacterium gregoryi SP2]SFI57485.1 hydrogenase expression/formation protein HypE [Natronobacterium gregoryi]
MPGKVPPDELFAHVFERTGDADIDETVLQGPADGEDAAAIDWPGGDLVVSSDPISLAASQVGNLGVHVACNDVAASGADPRWLTVVVLLPDETADLETITRDVDAAASEVGASVVGGHSEYVDQLERPLVSLTAMGATERFVPTGGAAPGDVVLLTKAAGIEGTAILAADFGDDLEVPPDVVDRATGFLEEISVVPDARAIREYATAMHDPTEGGVAAGLLELARASAVRLEVDRDAVPIREETDRLCEAVDVDPLRIFGSGGLLATVPEDERDDALEALADAGLEAASIGTVREGEPELRLGEESIVEPVADDLYPLWEAADASTS